MAAQVIRIVLRGCPGRYADVHQGRREEHALREECAEIQHIHSVHIYSSVCIQIEGRKEGINKEYTNI